jgi:hypothetical protein
VKRRDKTLAERIAERDQAAPNGKTKPPSEASGKPEGAAPEPWAPPVPFNRPGDVPPFPAALLPPWLAEWVLAEAEATQTPPDLAGCLALAIAGAALARKVRVLIRPGWLEPANIFTVVSLPPGDRKSAVFVHALSPLVEYERAEQQRMEPIIAEIASEHRVMEFKLKALEQKAARKDAPDAKDTAEADVSREEERKLRQEAKHLAKELAAHHVPDSPEFICDEATVQKVGQLIARQGGRMLQASAEGTAFEIAKGRYSETADFDIYLKGHAGDPLRVGRVSRESEALNHPALSCALAVQPDVIRGLAEQACMRGRGFLARWLYALPASKVGKRKVDAAPVPVVVSARYRQGMLWLWQLPPSDIQGQEAGREVEFCPGANDAMRELQSWLEPQLAEGEPLSYLAGWANKLAGACARLSLILHMAATLGAGEGWTGAISRETVEAAINLGRDYYLPHAKAAFGTMGANERQQDASRVVEWLAKRLNSESLKTLKGGAVVSKSEVHSGVFGGSRSAEEVSAVCRLLCDHGYLRIAGPAWRRDSQRFEVNPGCEPGDENG